MNKLYLTIIPGTDFFFYYYLLCARNQQFLKQQKLHYLFTKNIWNCIPSHQHIHAQLFLAARKTPGAIEELKRLLMPFEHLAAQTHEDILLCFDAGFSGIIRLFQKIITSCDFPALSCYELQIVHLLCPQEEEFEGCGRFLGPNPQISQEKRLENYLSSCKTSLDQLYAESCEVSTLPPKILLADQTTHPNPEDFFRQLDREWTKGAVQPDEITLLDRHASAFFHSLADTIKLHGTPPPIDTAAALHQIGLQHWSDSCTWASPDILQEIRSASKAGNQRLAQQLFKRNELFEKPCTLPHTWTPYQGLSPELHVQILVKLMEESPLIRCKLEDAFSCRWQYTLLPPKEKKLFPDPNSPQVLAQEPLVSVLTLTRNQASMIGENIESILAQKTRFPFQHIIVDDGSKDGTQDIITEYAARYPRLIKPILLKHKAPHGENVRALFEQCRSKYAVLCDGDDYFTDPGKLQTQVDFMERNPDCALCFHPVSVVYEDGTPTKTYPPADLLPGGERLWYSLRDLLISNFIQTNSVMYRWRFQDGLPEWFDPTLIPGDWYWHLLHAETGKIAYLHKPMSAYRRHAASLYAHAEKDHVAHRHEHGLNELRAYNVCNAHFRNRYYKDFSRLARGVFADFVQDYLKTKDDSLLQEGIAAAPDFARDFLSLLASQNMHLPPSRG